MAPAQLTMAKAAEKAAEKAAKEEVKAKKAADKEARDEERAKKATERKLKAFDKKQNKYPICFWIFGSSRTGFIPRPC